MPPPKLKHGMAKGLYAGKHPAWKPAKDRPKRPGSSSNQKLQKRATRGGYR